MNLTAASSSDRVSRGMADILDALSADDRASLVAILRDTNTFLAEDIDDVIAILNELEG